MRKVRNTSRDCINCGGHVPADVTHFVNGGIEIYSCPRCEEVLLEGIVAEDGEPARARRAPPRANPNNPILVRDDIEFSTWETWWTDRAVVTMIHGRVVAGDTKLKDFVSKVLDIHGHS